MRDRSVTGFVLRVKINEQNVKAAIIPHNHIPAKKKNKKKTKRRDVHTLPVERFGLTVTSNLDVTKHGRPTRRSRPSWWP